MLSNNQLQRYNRNILINQIGEKGQERLLNAKVLVCGTGGLGSTVIANLASLGVGNLGIVDDDILEISNLNRQYIHNLSAIGHVKTDSAKNWIENYNKDIKVVPYKIRLDENNYETIVKDYDIIVDCFDSFRSKFLLNDIAIKTDKPLVHGGVTEFRGQALTILPKKSACLRCIFPDADFDAYVVKGVTSPTVSTIASIESMEVLKLILDIGELLTDKLLVFDGLKMDFKVLKVKHGKNCICAP